MYNKKPQKSRFSYKELNNKKSKSNEYVKRELDIYDVDRMSGRDFERFLKFL